MPGIAGTTGINKGPLQYLNQTLDLMLDTLSQDWYASERYTSPDGVAIGITNLPHLLSNSCPYMPQDGSLAICIFGEIYGAAIDHSATVGTATNKLIADAYIASENDFAKDLTGEYFIVIHDLKRNKVVLATDRYGRRPVYYTQVDGQIIFSSEIKAIMAHPSFNPIIDHEGLADLLSFGYILGERTLLENIALMPPASILEYDLITRSSSIERYWNICDHLGVHSNPDKEILNRISTTFKEAVDLRLSDTSTNWISLSGGMDSRVIAAVIDAERSPVKTVTSGVEGSYERIVTNAISREIGCDHLFYTFNETEMTQAGQQLMSLFREAIILTDGMRGTASNAMTAFSARKRKQHGLDIVLTGHGGEIAKLDQAYGLAIRGQEDTDKISADRLHWAFSKMTHSNAPELNNAQLYTGELAGIFNDAPIAHLKSEVDKLDQSVHPAQFVSYLFIHELFRKRALYALMVHRAYTCVRLPFYDDDFLDAVIQAPLHLRSNNRIHGHIISQFKPELLNIVLTDSRARPFAGKIERLSKQIPFRIGRKLGLYKRDFPEDFFAAHTNRDFFRNILLDPVTLDRGYFNPDLLRKILKSEENISENNYSLLHHLSIVEIWHRIYIDKS